MEEIPIGKDWEWVRQIELWQFKDNAKAITHVQVPMAASIKVGQKYTYWGEEWVVGIRYATPWRRCVDNDKKPLD